MASSLLDRLLEYQKENNILLQTSNQKNKLEKAS